MRRVDLKFDRIIILHYVFLLCILYNNINIYDYDDDDDDDDDDDLLYTNIIASAILECV